MFHGVYCFVLFYFVFLFFRLNDFFFFFSPSPVYIFICFILFFPFLYSFFLSSFRVDIFLSVNAHQLFWYV